MTEPLQAQVAALADRYARDLARCVPSQDLDARIDGLVAAPPPPSSRTTGRQPGARRTAPRWLRWSAAACLGAIAVAAGVFIGMRVERAAAPPPVATAREPAWPSAELAMWPADSVAIKIPAEVSPRGTLVAVDGKSRSAGTRYWVDVVVSNDGTVRIENVVPAAEHLHGTSTQNP